ncbi:hypothetical protein [Microvirga sp. G4-2]|uniref:hypothetical protein n=1 Tax=Microvirga sp. G4-2 TaxID=3434467 RepID=UPI00404458D8
MAVARAEHPMRDYLYERVTFRVLAEDMNFGEDAPRPGDRLPDFDLPTTDGPRLRTRDFVGSRPIP